MYKNSSSNYKAFYINELINTALNSLIFPANSRIPKNFFKEIEIHEKKLSVRI